tara:strand:+ start:2092 stop:2610 length:519 start_codon:yes stop_codon:yes gene_type:complete
MTTEIEDIFNNISPPEEADGGSRKKRRKDDADKIPDGVYQAKIVEFSTFHKDDDYGNRDYFTVMWFQVTTGPAAGAEVQSFSSVGPKSVPFIKRAIKKVTGKEPSWSDLYDKEMGSTGSIQFKLVGKHVEIQQKTNGKYANIYINKVIDSSGEQGSASPANDDSDRNVDDLF